MFGVLAQAVTLSDEARAAAPDLSGADFSYAAVETGLRHRRALDPKALLVARLSATGGRNWYGGEALSDYLQIEAGLDRRLDADSVLGFGLAAHRVARIDSARQSSDRIEASLDYARELPSGDTLTLGLTGARAVSDSPEVGNEAVGLSLGWARAEPLAGIGLSAGVGVESRLFEQSRYAEGGREDVRLTANLTMSFDRVDYMGFSPVLDLRATRNRSNAALYDTQDLGITLGIRSTF